MTTTTTTSTTTSVTTPSMPVAPTIPTTHTMPTEDTDTTTTAIYGYDMFDSQTAASLVNRATVPDLPMILSAMVLGTLLGGAVLMWLRVAKIRRQRVAQPLTTSADENETAILS